MLVGVDRFEVSAQNAAPFDNLRLEMRLVVRLVSGQVQLAAQFVAKNDGSPSPAGLRVAAEPFLHLNGAGIAEELQRHVEPAARRLLVVRVQVPFRVAPGADPPVVIQHKIDVDAVLDGQVDDTVELPGVAHVIVVRAMVAADAFSPRVLCPIG